jgi:hypothetical protein
MISATICFNFVSGASTLLAYLDILLLSGAKVIFIVRFALVSVR